MRGNEDDAHSPRCMNAWFPIPMRGNEMEPAAMAYLDGIVSDPHEG